MMLSANIKIPLSFRTHYVRITKITKYPSTRKIREPSERYNVFLEGSQNTAMCRPGAAPAQDWPHDHTVVINSNRTHCKT